MKIVEIYTDGSHIKGTDKIGYGACFEDPDNNEKLYKLSNKLNMKAFEKRYHEKVSNPTTELIAVLMSIKSLVGLKDHVFIVYSDYEGVQKWLNKKWKIKKKYILDIVNEIQRLLKEHEKNRVFFAFKWIKAHSANPMNDLADKLAKKMSDENTFHQYLNENLKTNLNEKWD